MSILESTPVSVNLTRRGASLLRVSIALLNVLPVDNLPDILEVLGAVVLIVEVVRVLPHIDTEKRDEIARCREVSLRRKTLE
jgi:hypothetical protein